MPYDPSELVRAYLAQATGTGATALPVPEGMGDMRAKMLDPVAKLRAAALDPNYVGKSTSGIAPGLGADDSSGGGAQRQPVSSLRFDLQPSPILKNSAPDEDMFKFKDYVADKAKDKEKESEAERIARVALEKLRAQATTTPATPPAPGTPAATPKPAMTPTQGPDTGAENPNADPVRRQAFLKMAVPYALEVSKATGIDPRLILAQAAHESAWGTAAPGYNYFGQKAGPNEQGQTLATKEMVDGKLVPTQAKFRTFQTPQESFQSYGNMMKTRPNYAGVIAAKSLPEQLIALGKSGYATDTGYLPKIVKVIESLPPEVLAQLTAGDTSSAPPQQTEPDTRARGGAIHDLLAYSRNYK
jgi:flagellum-specific peptidoglycan hydrolase FlgJ